MAARTIQPEVLEVLNRSIIMANSLQLPGQLERKLYEQTMKVIKDHGGKWDRKSQSHIFQRDPRESLGIALQTGKTESQQSIKQAFFTPRVIASEMIDMAHLCKDDTILEPSAGEGNLIDAIHASGQPVLKIEAIELDPGHVQLLKAKYPVTGKLTEGGNTKAWGMSQHKVWVRQGDFLSMTPQEVYAPLFSCVLMNPPFTKGQDVKHILHAWKFLRSGGRLISIASAAVRYNTTANYRELRNLIEDYGMMRDLPPGSFKESGTAVNTVLILLKKPE